jgi:SAM-dependent methyltransferase
MPSASSIRPYKLLARYYDQMFAAYVSWSRRTRRRLLGEILPRMRSACDVCCGTGTTALELARQGIKVYAVDLSPTMCRLARAKVRRAGAPVTVIRGDMRTFQLPEQVDLITCEFDALNHVPRKGDLIRVAKAAARALRPGGYFYFDVNNRLHLEKNWPSTWWLEKPGVVMVMRGSYDRRRAKGCEDVEWFIRKAGGWRRFRERVEEVWWTGSEVRQALRAAGFRRIQTWDASLFARGNPYLRAGCRTFYLARKKPNQADCAFGTAGTRWAQLK